MRLSRTEFENLLSTLGTPFFYNHTTEDEVVDFPFIVYLDGGTSNFVADNKVFDKTINYTLILHCDQRNETLEGQIETLFDSNMIPWELQDVEWDEDYLMWVTTYSFDL